MLMVCAFLSVL